MKKVFLSGFVALGLLAASCSNDDILNNGNNGNGNENETGSLNITIQGESSTTRAKDDEVGTDDEKSVKSFTVYVFNNNTDILEKSATFTNPENFTGTIEGLSVASQKKVVVLVNKPESYPTTAITKYSDFTNIANMVSLDSQAPSNSKTNGFFMSGESEPVQLNALQVVNVKIQVKRMVAKIMLGSLKIDSEAVNLLPDFKLTRVSIQKARDNSLALNELATEGFNYVSGIVPNDANAEKIYLHEAYELPENYTINQTLEPKKYFYVFPNDASEQATMMTIAGTYRNKEIYYTFKINDKASDTNGNSTDGNNIERNKIYTLHVTLKKLGNGGEDPNIPNENADLSVTVEVADWDGELEQEVEW